ncbi:heavy metal-associated isoprenylated plant protein 2-like [Lolium rigidum]|uniref:heavy metal-associated isoprenylated plant protein 2-like n=1 Tax=Lolium rigidum TaxID=89674 RepID=UPI001F5D466B|nr:heavy metal-associated isoprenylated plant protein 2-like [Lolium rigidum]
MSKKTVLRVDTSCGKCKRKVLLAVSSLQGVDKIEIDSEKGTMTVTGGVDPVDVVEATRRKACKRADIVTIGSATTTAPSSSKPEEKKKPEQKPQQQQWEEKTYVVAAAAAERRAPEPPMTVYVHHVPPPPHSWHPAYDQHGAVVGYQHDPCSIM